jgi:hypothetical protein
MTPLCRMIPLWLTEKRTARKSSEFLTNVVHRVFLMLMDVQLFATIFVRGYRWIKLLRRFINRGG